MTPTRRNFLACGTGTVFGMAPFALVAQDRASENRPLRIVVPFTPGGSTDLLARALAPRLALALGRTVLIDNKPGAGGSLGATEVARAEVPKNEGDAITLLMGHIGTLAVNPAIYPKLAYDPLTSFVPVAAVARVPNVMVVNAAMPAKTLKEFVQRARAQPGRLTYSSGGNGSAAQIAFESFKLAAQIFLLHIPYRGSVPSITDLLAGQVDATFTGAPALLQHIKSGRLRALAVSSAKRLPSLLDVPTVAESGYPGFEADQWYGLVAPAGLPNAWVERLNAEVNKALTLPEVAQQLALEGALPMPGRPQDFGALIAREIPRWAEVVRRGKVKAD